jgi:hypothetical protein
VRTSRTTLAALAALPLVAALAACSNGGSPAAVPSFAPSSTSTSDPAPSPSGTSPRPSGSESGVAAGVGTGRGAGATVSHRPTTAQAVATVRAYMTREIGMRTPVAGPFRWTGTDTGEVTVRPRLVTGALGPATVVSLTRLRTVWYVDGTRTDGIVVDRTPLDRRLGSSVRLVGSLRTGGSWRVTVTQDRYGPDIRLGGSSLDPYASGWFSTTVTTARATASTGSVIFSEDAGNGGGTLRATVVRVRFAPAPPPAPCAPERLLPVLKAWFDDPAAELYITKVNVLACRNGYAHVTGLPRINPVGHSQYDGFTMYLQDRAGRWHSLDYGTDISCDDPQVAEACRALGEVK